MKKAFIPFSIGGRSCPGQKYVSHQICLPSWRLLILVLTLLASICSYSIAMFDLRLFLATIARNFDIVCPPETTWAGMKPFDLTTVSPRSGKCDLIFKPRTAPAEA